MRYKMGGSFHSRLRLLTNDDNILGNRRGFRRRVTAQLWQGEKTRLMRLLHHSDSLHYTETFPKSKPYVLNK